MPAGHPCPCPHSTQESSGSGRQARSRDGSLMYCVKHTPSLGATKSVLSSQLCSVVPDQVGSGVPEARGHLYSALREEFGVLLGHLPLGTWSYPM